MLLQPLNYCDFSSTDNIGQSFRHLPATNSPFDRKRSTYSFLWEQGENVYKCCVCEVYIMKWILFAAAASNEYLPITKQICYVQQLPLMKNTSLLHHMNRFLMSTSLISAKTSLRSSQDLQNKVFTCGCDKTGNLIVKSWFLLVGSCKRADVWFLAVFQSCTENFIVKIILFLYHYNTFSTYRWHNLFLRRRDPA